MVAHKVWSDNETDEAFVFCSFDTANGLLREGRRGVVEDGVSRTAYDAAVSVLLRSSAHHPTSLTTTRQPSRRS